MSRPSLPRPPMPAMRDPRPPEPPKTAAELAQIAREAQDKKKIQEEAKQRKEQEEWLATTVPFAEYQDAVVDAAFGLGQRLLNAVAKQGTTSAQISVGGSKDFATCLSEKERKEGRVKKETLSELLDAQTRSMVPSALHRHGVVLVQGQFTEHGRKLEQQFVDLGIRVSIRRESTASPNSPALSIVMSFEDALKG